MHARRPIQQQINWDTFPGRGSEDKLGIERYVSMIDNLRRFLDLTAGGKPDAATLLKISLLLEGASDLLEPFQTPDLEEVFGRSIDLDGRAQTLIPPFTVTSIDEYQLAGTVVFGRHFLGSKGAAHGGAITLVFDEVLGRLSMTSGRARCRTAYLHVNYRNVAPIGVELDFTARFVREEGRKRYLAAELRHGDTICADAEGLFVELKNGQP